VRSARAGLRDHRHRAGEGATAAYGQGRRQCRTLGRNDPQTVVEAEKARTRCHSRQSRGDDDDSNQTGKRWAALLGGAGEAVCPKLEVDGSDVKVTRDGRWRLQDREAQGPAI